MKIVFSVDFGESSSHHETLFSGETEREISSDIWNDEEKFYRSNLEPTQFGATLNENTQKKFQI